MAAAGPLTRDIGWKDLSCDWRLGQGPGHHLSNEPRDLSKGLSGHRENSYDLVHAVTHRRNVFVLVVVTATLLTGTTQSRAQSESRYFDYPIESEMVFFRAGTGGNCSSCTWIVAEGIITKETPARFETFLKKKAVEGRYQGDIHLNSHGGDLLGGMKLGELIRKYNLNTMVGKTVGALDKSQEYIDAYRNNEAPNAVCASACAYAFLGGVTRYSVSDHYKNAIAVPGMGKLGVDQFYSELSLKGISSKLFDATDISKDQVVTGILLEYVNRMGVDSQLVAIASRVPPWEGMHLLTDAELRSTGVENAERNVSVGIAVLDRNSASS